MSAPRTGGDGDSAHPGTAGAARGSTGDRSGSGTTADPRVGAVPPASDDRDGSVADGSDDAGTALARLRHRVPRPTRRGRFVATVAVVGLAMGHTFGGRGLNAVVVPAVALLAVGAVQVARARDPSVSRRLPRVAHDGDEVTVRLALEGTTGVVVRVADRLPAALAGDARFDAVPDGRTLRYAATVTARGVHDVGPARLAVTDLLGLWERSVESGGTDAIVAFPRVHQIHESTDLLEGYVGLSNNREQFDGIREYHPGDALRDVNWKASAKRTGDLVVTEYAGEGAHNRVTVGVTASPDRDDSAAEAAASVVAYLFESGLAVGVVTPTAVVEPGSGDAHRRRVLTALARFRGGSDDERDFAVEPDVTVRASAVAPGVQVVLGGDTHAFADVVGEYGVVT
ncbi:MAG: DUF58 domain-containing protein [Halobacteriaceae archaeon]